MKSHPHRNFHLHRSVGSTPLENHDVCDRAMHVIYPRPPPPIPYRRHRSLSDDSQPYFPRFRRARRFAAKKNVITVPSSNPRVRSRLLSVRTFALLAIVAIIAALIIYA